MAWPLKFPKNLFYWISDIKALKNGTLLFQVIILKIIPNSIVPEGMYVNIMQTY